MNSVLINKLLDKLSFKDLYDEIKDNEKLMCNLGIILAKKKPEMFAKIIRSFVNGVIKGNDKDYEDFFKVEIINMDSEEVSINKTVKKVAVKKPPIDDDLCSRGFGYTRPTC